jgi:DNA polymerase
MTLFPLTDTRRKISIEVPPHDTLDRILADLHQSPHCGKCKGGMPIVFGMGPHDAELMSIGEGAGIDDMRTAEPFQGQAGILLNRMLAAIDLKLSDCYVCNVIKCIPLGERVFSPEEVADCRPILLRQVLAVRPRVIVAFGALAAQTLLQSNKTISDLRGRSYSLRINDLEASLVPTFNPAYLLRVPLKKRDAWEDLKLVRGLLKK